MSFHDCRRPAGPVTQPPQGLPTPARRRRALRGADSHFTGHAAEDAAHAAYAALGGEVLARRFRTPEGEVDLVVRLGDLVCFVEVKRRKKALPDSPVSHRAWSRIASAAARWLAEEQAASGRVPHCRFDAVLVDRDGRATVLEDAWRPAA